MSAPATQPDPLLELIQRMESGEPLYTDSPEILALAEKAVRAQSDLRMRLNSSDPEVRRQAESEVIKAATSFIMDTRFGGP